MYIFIFLIYYLSGILSFIYWFTKDDDITIGTIPLLLMMGILGPFSFIIGYSIHGKQIILIKKRKK